MDPNIQVAVVSVFATMITTLGVISVAIINNRKERDMAATAGVTAGLDEKDILGRLLILISDNERKDAQIIELQKRIAEKESECRALRKLQPKEAP